MKKIAKMGEISWAIGTFLCAFGVALCAKADLGLSMVAAPAYILHVAISKVLPWYTHGTSEYIWQAFLLLLTCIIVKKFRPRYLLSFLSAFLSGLAIDLCLTILGGGGAYSELWQRIVALAVGECCIALAVAFIFRTYFPVQVVELIVVETAGKYKLDTGKVKLFNDLISLALSLVLAFTLTGGFEGVGVGTIVITFVNAPLIKLFGKLIDKIFDFEPAFPNLRNFLLKI